MDVNEDYDKDEDEDQDQDQDLDQEQDQDQGEEEYQDDVTLANQAQFAVFSNSAGRCRLLVWQVLTASHFVEQRFIVVFRSLIMFITMSNKPGQNRTPQAALDFQKHDLIKYVCFFVDVLSFF